MKKKLAKASFFYGVGIFISRFFSFLSIPLITRSLDVNTYGKYGLVTSAAGFLSLLFTMGLGNGLLRYGSDANERNNSTELSDYIYNVIILVLIFSIFGFLIIYLIGLRENKFMYAWIGLLSLIMANKKIINNILRVQNKTFYYFLISVLFSFTFFLGILILYNYNTLNFNNIIIVLILSNFLSCLFGFYLNINVIFKGRINKVIMFSLLSFSIPLLGAYVAEYILNYLDLWMIKLLADSKEVGLFNFSKKFSFILSSIKSVFFLAWPYFAFTNINQKGHKEVFDFLTFFILIFVNIFFLIFRPVITLIGTEKYLSTDIIIVILFMSMILNIVGTFLDTTASINKNTVWITIIVSFGLIIDLISNYYFIPSFGARGAALATTISYISMFLLRYIIYSYKFDFKGWSNKSIILVMINVLIYFFFTGLYSINPIKIAPFLIILLLYYYRYEIILLKEEIKKLIFNKIF